MSQDKVLHESFVEAKDARRRAEQDAKILANRIAQLKAAESKAQRKILEVKQKAADVEAAKQRTAMKTAKKLFEKQVEE